MPTSLVTLNDAVLSDRRRKSERREGKLLFFSFSTRRAIFLFLYLFLLFSPTISPLLALHTLRLSLCSLMPRARVTVCSRSIPLFLPLTRSLALSLSLFLSIFLSLFLFLFHPPCHFLSLSLFSLARSRARSPYRSLFVTDTREAT